MKFLKHDDYIVVDSLLTVAPFVGWGSVFGPFFFSFVLAITKMIISLTYRFV